VSWFAGIAVGGRLLLEQCQLPMANRRMAVAHILLVLALPHASQLSSLGGDGALASMGHFVVAKAPLVSGAQLAVNTSIENMFTALGSPECHDDMCLDDVLRRALDFVSSESALLAVSARYGRLQSATCLEEHCGRVTRRQFEETIIDLPFGLQCCIHHPSQEQADAVQCAIRQLAVASGDQYRAFARLVLTANCLSIADYKEHEALLSAVLQCPITADTVAMLRKLQPSVVIGPCCPFTPTASIASTYMENISSFMCGSCATKNCVVATSAFSSLPEMALIRVPKEDGACCIKPWPVLCLKQRFSERGEEPYELVFGVLQNGTCLSTFIPR
jgi:hypothetical protein